MQKNRLQKKRRSRTINLSHLFCGQIAQSVEQRTENPCVAGSIPVLATPVGALYVPLLFFCSKIACLVKSCPWPLKGLQPLNTP
jgi:hypothetical protein